ncbi:heavy-metal-associated domain-containing protein [Streptomyces sp. NPDC001848]|uniref:heavy-metal-associated domain-containing protein n=1 Tax=Streptomyces sp. NPDC001848 TaxID=3364618 RepID=UPI00368C6BED
MTRAGAGGARALGAAGARTAGRVAPVAARAGLRVAGESGRVAARTGLRVAEGSGRVAARAGLRVAEGSGRVAVAAVRQGVSAAAGVPGRAVRAGRVLADLHPRRHTRHVWASHGRAHIEVRGLDRGARTRERLVGGVTRALRGLNGVRWAEVNAVTGQVLLSFDERSVGVDRLLNTVRAVEKAQGVRDADFPWAQPVTPGDDAPVAAVTAELLVDCAAVAAGAVRSVFRLPSLPRVVAVAVAALELERGLRRPLVRRIGPLETDLLLSLAGAVVGGLYGGIGMPAVDAANRMLLLGEIRARRQVWERRERELCPGPSCVPHTRPARHLRGRARPPGPVERWEAGLAPVAPLTAAAVFALTGSTGRAADALLAAVPRAARYGREAFAATVGRELARRGVVPLDPSALRLFDVVTAVVVDSAVLVTEGGRPAPLAAPVLDAARATGARLVLTDGERISELLGPADEIVGGRERLADRVCALRDHGEGVLVISGTDAEALAAADIAVAVPAAPGVEASWSADLVCADGLEDVWRVLRAVTGARTVSRRCVRLALAGSATGTLLAVLGPRRGVLRALTPVQVTSLLALLSSVATARRAVHGRCRTDS